MFRTSDGLRSLIAFADNKPWRYTVPIDQRYSDGDAFFTGRVTSVLLTLGK